MYINGLSVFTIDVNRSKINHCSLCLAWTCLPHRPNV